MDEQYEKNQSNENEYASDLSSDISSEYLKNIHNNINTNHDSNNQNINNNSTINAANNDINNGSIQSTQDKLNTPEELKGTKEISDSVIKSSEEAGKEIAQDALEKTTTATVEATGAASSGGTTVLTKVALETLKAATKGTDGFAQLSGVLFGIIIAISILAAYLFHSLMPTASQLIVESNSIVESTQENWNNANTTGDKIGVVFNTTKDAIVSVAKAFLGGLSNKILGKSKTDFLATQLANLAKLSEDQTNSYKYSLEGVESPYTDTYDENITLMRKAMSQYYGSALEQIKEKCEEDGKDEKLSIKSFKAFHELYPPFNEDYSNINFKELLGITAETEDYNVENFDAEKYAELMSKEDTIRKFYWLNFIPAEYKTGSEETGTLSVTKYYEVQIYRYTLEDIYNIYGMSGSDKNYVYPKLTNYSLLEYQVKLIESYGGLTNFGINEKTPLAHNEVETKDNPQLDNSVISDDAIYEKDIENIIDEKEVKLSFPNYYNQATPQYTSESNRNITENLLLPKRYSSLSYGQGTIASSGCCLISLVMIGEYYTKQQLSIKNYQTPGNGYVIYDKGMGGYYINKYHMLDDLEIKYDHTEPFSITSACEILQSGNPIMIHFPKTSAYTRSGHYAVITGYNAETKIFYMNDPGSIKRTQSGISFKDMSINADTIYAYRK